MSNPMRQQQKAIGWADHRVYQNSQHRPTIIPIPTDDGVAQKTQTRDEWQVGNQVFVSAGLQEKLIQCNSTLSFVMTSGVM